MELYADLDLEDPFFSVESAVDSDSDSDNGASADEGGKEAVSSQLSAQLDELTQLNSVLSAQNTALRKNISCLYKTAQAEIKRKDVAVDQLHRRIELLEGLVNHMAKAKVANAHNSHNPPPVPPALLPPGQPGLHSNHQQLPSPAPRPTDDPHPPHSHPLTTTAKDQAYPGTSHRQQTGVRGTTDPRLHTRDKRRDANEIACKGPPPPGTKARKSVSPVECCGEGSSSIAHVPGNSRGDLCEEVERTVYSARMRRKIVGGSHRNTPRNDKENFNRCREGEKLLPTGRSDNDRSSHGREQHHHHRHGDPERAGPSQERGRRGRRRLNLDEYRRRVQREPRKRHHSPASGPRENLDSKRARVGSTVPRNRQSDSGKLETDLKCRREDLKSRTVEENAAINREMAGVEELDLDTRGPLHSESSSPPPPPAATPPCDSDEEQSHATGDGEWECEDELRAVIHCTAAERTTVNNSVDVPTGKDTDVKKLSECESSPDHDNLHTSSRGSREDSTESDVFYCPTPGGSESESEEMDYGTREYHTACSTSEAEPRTSSRPQSRERQELMESTADSVCGDDDKQTPVSVPSTLGSTPDNEEGEGDEDADCLVDFELYPQSPLSPAARSKMDSLGPDLEDGEIVSEEDDGGDCKTENWRRKDCCDTGRTRKPQRGKCHVTDRHNKTRRDHRSKTSERVDDPSITSSQQPPRECRPQTHMKTIIRDGNPERSRPPTRRKPLKHHERTPPQEVDQLLHKQNSRKLYFHDSRSLCEESARGRRSHERSHDTCTSSSARRDSHHSMPRSRNSCQPRPSSRSYTHRRH